MSALRAGFEEESVPLAVERAEGHGPRARPRRRGARRCSGSGSASTRDGACAVLAAAPAAAYLQAPLADVRAFAQDAARIAGRRPLRRRPAT